MRKTTLAVGLVGMMVGASAPPTLLAPIALFAGAVLVIQAALADARWRRGLKMEDRNRAARAAALAERQRVA